MQNLLEQPWFSWAVGIAVGLPLLTLVLGEIVVRLQRRHNALAGPLNIVRGYILPVAAIILLLTQVAALSPETVPIRILGTIFWMAVALTVLAFGNALLFVDAAQNSWRSRMPRIFVDLARLLLIGLCAALVYAQVWNQNVSGLITAIGLSSLVIGLTLQNSVGPIIAGLLLLFERPFALGDWLKVGEVTGKVVEVNWRATHLDTGNQLQVIPNGALAIASFSNFSRPVLMHKEMVALRFTLRDPPNRIKELLQDVATKMQLRVPDTTPDILVSTIDGDAITYVATLTIGRQADAPRARDEFLTLVYYAARREGMTLVGLAPYLIPDDEQLRAGLRQVAPLLRMSEADVQRLAPQARVQQFGRGETLLGQGAASTGLHFVLRGRAHALVDDPQHGLLNLLELGPGDYYGEDALTGERSTATIIALTDIQELVLEGEQLQSLVDEIPRLAHDLGETMEQRRRILRSLRQRSAIPQGRSATRK